MALNCGFERSTSRDGYIVALASKPCTNHGPIKTEFDSYVHALHHPSTGFYFGRLVRGFLDKGKCVRVRRWRVEESYGIVREDGHPFQKPRRDGAVLPVSLAGTASTVPVSFPATALDPLKKR